ncbi:HAD family hydrolase [Chitinophaga horti]|uniref:HAD family hydrolase n=1 Tax=Chitinophaga horti TaxID=2920382 RepID=A0ABY6J6T5_9BACT|nr:HAD family hydrolase [Chitinophaga horti]UYQ95307.1 HAD family hydrolase [Chitinophaga horti]
MIKVIAFDADDTLWVNEPYFQETEYKLCALLEDYLPHHAVERELLKSEIANLKLYGYGIKAFILSMIETAIRVSEGRAPITIVQQIMDFGKEMLQKPVELLEGIEDTLEALKGDYRLVVATKGDLLDQERKLKKSGLEHYFHHIEIMSDKQEADYLKLIRHLDIKPEEFLMIGNSLKSDVLPVLAIGGHGIHIPYHITWEIERVDVQVEHENFRQCATIREVLPFFMQ